MSLFPFNQIAKIIKYLKSHQIITYSSYWQSYWQYGASFFLFTTVAYYRANLLLLPCKSDVTHFALQI